jgi:hypothetical protein
LGDDIIFSNVSNNIQNNSVKELTFNEKITNETQIINMYTNYSMVKYKDLLNLYSDKTTTDHIYKDSKIIVGLKGIKSINDNNNILKWNILIDCIYICLETFT